MKKKVCLMIMLTGICMGVFAESTTDPTTVSSKSDEVERLLLDDNSTYIPLEGILPQIDYTRFFALQLNGGVLLVKQMFGDAYTYLQVMVDVSPYSTEIWPRLSDGSKNINWATDPQSVYNQLKTGWNVTIFQGLFNDPSYPVPPYLNILNIFLGYYGYYSYNYNNQSPDVRLYESDLPDRQEWLAHIFKGGILFNNVRTNRLINTKQGHFGQLQFEWAPREIGNDLIGYTDFTRLSSFFSNFIPILEKKDFSLYLFQRTGFDIAWGDIPVGAQYGLAAPRQSIGYGAIRGTVFWDGYMHAGSCLDIRGSFPTAFEPGIMPGFSIFWDVGLYDDYDYQFSFNQIANTVGINFLLHMDSASIMPVSAILDIQLGISYDITNGYPSFQFGMFLPQ